MEILTTEKFLDCTKKNPDAVRGHLQRVANALPPAGLSMAAQLEDKEVLGFSVREKNLAIWCVAEPESLGSADEPALASMSKSELRDLGVDEASIPKVQRVCNAAELDALGLPDQISQLLRFEIIQRVNGFCEDELRYRATDVDHLDRYLHGDIRKLLLNLDPSQRKIVELDGADPIIVRGVAGSGKTAVALERIYSRLNGTALLGAPHMLFVAYNKALASAAKELLHSKGIRLDDLNVMTFHKLCMTFLPNMGLRVLEDNEKEKLIDQARLRVRSKTQGAATESKIWDYPSAFWVDEIHRIKANGLSRAEEYRELVRYGAGRPLDPRLRPYVWEVLQVYRAMQNGRLDWDDVVQKAYDRLQAMGNAAQYDEVLVDEAQDLTVMAMRVIRALCKPKGVLFVSYDPAQSIYERGFRWKNYGITVHPHRSFELRTNFRNTAEILGVARIILAGMMDTEDGKSKAAEEVLEPGEVRQHGPGPQFMAVEPRNECTTIVDDIVRRIKEEGVPPQNIAVLCYPNRIRDKMFKSLESAGVGCQRQDHDTVISLGDRSVKVLPIKSAKGLEFPVVYLMATGANFKPPFDDDSENTVWLEQMGRCFYMAMTRAMKCLTVVYDKKDPVVFLKAVLAADGRSATPVATVQEGKHVGPSGWETPLPVGRSPEPRPTVLPAVPATGKEEIAAVKSAL